MDVLYRSGETQQVSFRDISFTFCSFAFLKNLNVYVVMFVQGVSTYTPRLLSINFKGTIESCLALKN